LSANINLRFTLSIGNLYWSCNRIGSDKHIFSSQDLVWSDIEREDGTIDRIALIPNNRLEDFIMGEQNNSDAPYTFVRRSHRKHFGDGESFMMGPTSLNYALLVLIMTS
jgi:hypothetical protein